MSIRQLNIDPDLEYFDPELIKDGYNKTYRLILGNVEELENYDIKVELYKIYVNEDECEQYEGTEQPWKIALCDNCEGQGTHLVTSLRNIAFSSYDEDYDPEFMNDMCNGHYDQTCEVCKGQGRIITLAESCSKEVKEMLGSHYEAERDYRAEVEQERRMGY